MAALVIGLDSFRYALGRRGLPRALAVAAITVAIGVVAALVPVSPASAATVTFDTPGTYSSVVPAGMTEATIDVFGAQGGTGFELENTNGAGGLGGRATVTIPVTPGETLVVKVGGRGGDGDPFGGGDGLGGSGGFNGGGAGGAFEGCCGGAGGGGGASEVRRGGDRIVVAGGGGGGGSDPCGRFDGGGGGGSMGDSGQGGVNDLFCHVVSSPPVEGGGGGTQSEGGAGGAAPGGVAGGAGSSGIGGPGGANFIAAGGGGGGGYFGGGGGGAVPARGGGGGGGSGFGPAGVVFQTGVKAGNGSVSITYFVLESDHDEGTLDLEKTAPATTTHGADLTYQYTLTYTPGADGSPATGVLVTDDNCSPVTRGPDMPGNNDALLEAGETWTSSCTYSVASHSAGEEDPIVNTATASAVDLDGDPVTGDTDSESVDIIHEMERKQSVRESLATKQGTADAKDAKRIGKAIEHLDKSLEGDLWVDDNHLDAKKGHRVFEEEKKAVHELQKVENIDVTPEILEIVVIDRGLAQTAYDEASAGKEKDKAAEELAKGDSKAAEGKYEEAIEHYKHAWERAVKAG